MRRSRFVGIHGTRSPSAGAGLHARLLRLTSVSALGAFVLMAVVVARASEPAEERVPSEEQAAIIRFSVRFEGWLGFSSGERKFGVAILDPAERLVARGWFTLGQTVGGFRLTAFDAKAEKLSVRDYQGTLHELHLQEGRVRSALESEPDATSESTRAAARARAFARIDEYLRKLREQADAPLDLVVDADGVAMPEDVRRRFLGAREREESRGGYLVGVWVRGEWVFSRFAAPASEGGKRMIPDELGEADRREVEVAWALAFAEAAGHVIAERQRQTVTASAANQ